MISFLTPFKGYIIAGVIVALVAAGGFLYWKGGSDTRSSINAKQNEQRLDTIGKAKENEEKVNKMPESDLDRDLDGWMRD